MINVLDITFIFFKRDKGWIVKGDNIKNPYKLLNSFVYHSTDNNFSVYHDATKIRGIELKRFPSEQNYNNSIKGIRYSLKSSQVSKKNAKLVHNLMTSKDSSNIIIGVEIIKNLIKEREKKLVKNE